MGVPGYSQVRQTVSEIGEVGSPMRLPFTLLLCSVAACVLVFASALRDVSRQAGRSALSAYLTGFMAISVAGVGIFAFPHPLHGVFGLSELIAYQAPLAWAVTWRRSDQAVRTVAMSWVMLGLVWIAIVLNLSTLDRDGWLWLHERPFYGLVQRFLFDAWFLWCLILGVQLFGRENLKAKTAQSA